MDTHGPTCGWCGLFQSCQLVCWFRKYTQKTHLSTKSAFPAIITIPKHSPVNLLIENINSIVKVVNPCVCVKCFIFWKGFIFRF